MPIATIRRVWPRSECSGGRSVDSFEIAATALGLLALTGACSGPTYEASEASGAGAGGASTNTTATTGTGGADAVGPIYVLDMQEPFVSCFGSCEAEIASKGGDATTAGLDELLFAVSVQGIVNRQGPRLYLVTHEADEFWLDRAMDDEAWGWANGANRIELSSVTDLLELFGSELSGAVRWTDSLPSTLNVATTMAGAHGLAIVRQGSALEPSILEALGIAPEHDLVGAFSSKLDAMQWARTNYLDASSTAATDPTLLGYLLDGHPWAQLAASTPPASVSTPSIAARDFLIAERGYCFDLSPWGDESPIDDPTQPMGGDRSEFLATLSTARERADGSRPVSLWGFFQEKYTHGLHPNGVFGEWETTKLASQHGARLTGGGGQMFGVELANASFHRWGSFPRHAPRHPTPTPGELADLGYLNQWLSNPGFERGTLDAWQIDTTNRTVYEDGSAPGGGRRLLQLNGEPGQSLLQDVLVPPQAGEKWRLRVQYRLPDADARATLVLWATGGATNEAAQLSLQEADGAWHQAEVELTVSGPGHTALRAQVYVDSPGANIALDEFRLARTLPWSSEVADLTFVSFFMADYDLGVAIYGVPVAVYPRGWLQAERGTIPLGWNFAPDTIEYLPGILHYYWATRSTSDFFTVPNSGAGYVNPSFMPQPDRDLFVRYSRDAMGNLGESAMSLYLDGLAGAPEPAIVSEWSALGADGVSANQLDTPSQFLDASGAPWLAIDGNSWAYAGISLKDAIDALDSGYEARFGVSATGPRFLTGRNVYVGVDFLREVLEGAQDGHPERDYTAVDPYTLGYLFRKARGGDNLTRASWLEDTLPRVLTEEEPMAGTVTVRNDGWDIWSPESCELGVAMGGRYASPARSDAADLSMNPLPRAVGPGETVTIDVLAFTVERDDVTHLAYDLRCNGTWFESRLNIPYADEVSVAR